MKIDAIGVTSKDIKKTIEFYSILGFEFNETDGDHVEPVSIDGSARLMIDSINMVKDILGVEPKPSNHSSFAINYDSSGELNAIADTVKSSGFIVVKEPWNAPWGQRYCIVEDPDGYKVDLYSNL